MCTKQQARIDELEGQGVAGKALKTGEFRRDLLIVIPIPCQTRKGPLMGAFAKNPFYVITY